MTTSAYSTTPPAASNDAGVPDPRADAAPSVSSRLAAEGPSSSRRPAERYAWAIARIGLGWLFLWAFLDKLLGLGHDSTSEQAWINGGNPTKGYLSSAEGPLAGLYHSMAGGWLVNVLFMAGLLAVGVALMLGIARTLGTIGGVLLVLLMWTSHLPPDANPFLDDHLIYAVVFVGLLLAGADRTLGLGERWSRLGLVRRIPLLR